jgi:poly-beta-1,6-N-acetyl-D-glucosamine synthase
MSTASEQSVDPVPPRAAVLIACKDGAAVVDAAVRTAVQQSAVFVVSDGSTDRTADVARSAGAVVLHLEENVGKPAALRALLDHHFDELSGARIPEAFEHLIVIDDDTLLSPGFVRRLSRRLAKPGTAAVGGFLSSNWRGRPWNPWVGARTWATLRTQHTVVRAQAALRARTWISGASTGYRADVLDTVCRADTPYIVDDCYWCWEIQRNGMGRIAFEPRARCSVQEPTTLRTLYRQELRWVWGAWQGVMGHGVGLGRQRCDRAFLVCLVDLVLYVLALPTVLAVTAATNPEGLGRFALAYVGGYALVGALAATFSRNWRMLVLWPAMFVYDLMYRVVQIHGFVKAIRQPVVASCKWDSPARYAPAAS